jgi:hypothetical protein
MNRPHQHHNTSGLVVSAGAEMAKAQSYPLDINIHTGHAA